MSNKKFECEFCKKLYSTKGNLETHQKNTKACLIIRNDRFVIEEFECNYCNKVMSTSYSLNNHIKICAAKKVKESLISKDIIISNLNDKLKQKDKEIADVISLKDKELSVKDDIIVSKDKEIERLSYLLNNAITAPSVINNNSTQVKNEDNRTLNVITFLRETNKPITNKILEDNVKNLTLHHCLGGGTGLADYALKYPLSEAPIICTDSSRRNFKYLDEFNGRLLVNEDKELIQFNPRFFDTIKDRAEELLKKFIGTLDISEDYGMDKATETTHIIVDIKRSADGEKTMVSDDLVRRISVNTSFPTIIKAIKAN